MINSDRQDRPQSENKARSKTLQLDRPMKLKKEQLLLRSIQILKKPLEQRSQIEKSQIHQLLSHIKFFENLFDQKAFITYEIADSLNYVYVESDKNVFQIGDIGDKFYFILKGCVSVKIKINQPFGEHIFKEINYIREGGYFGELALQDGGTRSATITAISNVHLATLDRIKYQKLLGDYNKHLLDIKVQFFNKYEFFKNWSLREMKSFLYDVEHHSYDYGQRIKVNQQLGFIISGQIQVIRVVNGYDIQDHPMRTTKINSQQLNVDILYEHSIIGELGFINREGELKYQGTNRPKKMNDTKNFLITNGESTYEYLCHSNHLKIYTLSIDLINERFFDNETRFIFFVTKFNIKKQQQQIKKIINERVNLARKLEIQFYKDEEAKLDLQKIEHQLKFIVKQRCRSVTPQKINKNRPLRLLQDVPFEKADFINFKQKFQGKLSSGYLYKYTNMNTLESGSNVSKSIDLDHSRIIRTENSALEKFQTLCVQKNCSYLRIKNYFQQKKICHDKLYYQSFIK